ncbi:MAG: hypothetical protein JWR30_3712, partial [Conexibacter sp.]|nr:hypothetical protein [Conexibacter sp.]
MARFRALLALSLTTVAAALAAAPADAASVVVQQREPGDYLTAQRYEAPDAGPQTLTVVSPKFRSDGAPLDSQWTTITTLDFDRDGRIDAMVHLAYSAAQGDVVYQVRPVGAASTTQELLGPATCFAPKILGASPTTPGTPPIAGHTPLNLRAGTRMVSITEDFSTLVGTDGRTIGGMARYQPIITTIWTAGANSPGTPAAIQDWLPSAAGAGAGDGQCEARVTGDTERGYRLDPTRGTDRGQHSTPSRGQRMQDRTGDVAGGETDLVEAGIDQYTASQRPAYDVTADVPSGGFVDDHPVDLVLRFADGGALSSATYLSSASGNTPDALITTTGSAGAGEVTVQIQSGLSGLSNWRCYPRDGNARLVGGAVWAASSVGSITLPVTEDPATKTTTVRVALDRALGIYAGNGTGDHATFSWVATSMPIGGDPDYAPDVAGQSGGTRYGGCPFDGPDGGQGTEVNPFLMVKVTGTLFEAGIGLVPAIPKRNAPVTLSGQATSGGTYTYQFDVDGDGIYDAPTVDAHRTPSYRDPTQVGVAITALDGTYAVAVVTVVPGDPPPVAAFEADEPGPYPLGPGGVTASWTDRSTDDHPGMTRTWTLTKDGQRLATDDKPQFFYTFHGGEDGHSTLTLSVTDDEGATSTTSQDVEVLPGSGDSGLPTAAAIARVSPAGRVYARRDVVFSAASSSIRIGPVRFQWDLDGDGSFETDTGPQATVSTTYAGAGHRDVRVRITDGYGTVSTSAPLGVDVGAPVDRAPIVTLSAPDVVQASGDAQVVLDATGSSGSNDDDRSLTFNWDLNGDGSYETSTGATPKAIATLRGAGDHLVRVRATDAFGNQATAEKTIFVRGQAEVAHDCTGREQFKTVSDGPARVSGCWTSVTRPSAGTLWIARGNIALNGLVLQKGTKGTAKRRTFADCTGACASAQVLFNDESQGARIALDPSDGTLVSNGPVAVHATGSGVDLTLNDGPLDVTLPATTAKTEEGLIFHPPGGANLLFLKVADEAEVRFPEAGTATTSLTAQLPPQMPGAGGDVTLRSTESQGIVLDHLKIEVQTGVLSDYLKLAALSIEYDRADEQWTGAAELGLPGIKGKEFDLQVEITIAHGRFKSIFGQVDGLEVELGPGILLQRIRAGVGVDPLDLQGGIGISVGPKIAGTELLSADGDLRVTFPSQKSPFVLFQVAGNTKLLDQIELTRGILRFATNGFVEARGGISRSVGIGYFDADIGGWFTASQVNLTGNAEAGLQLLGQKVALLGAHAVLSTKGIAACGEVPVIKVGGGMAYRWGGKFTTFGGCDLGPYSEDRPEGLPDGFTVRAAAATRVPTVKLAAGLRSANIAVSGRGAPPKVTLLDAKGRLVADATAEQLTPKVMVLQDANTNTTQIVLKKPARGSYVVMPAEGSAAIVKVVHAVDAGPQRVRATVSGHGAQRTLRWTVKPHLAAGQQLTLGEASRLDGPGQEILTTGRSTGTRAFAPQEGHGEQRVVTATILTGGLGRPPAVAGRFAAPRTARPARPTGLTLRRSGRTVTLKWSAGTAPAGGWRVTVAAGSLRTVDAMVGAGRRSYALAEVPGQLPVTAKVVGIGSGRAAGAPGTVALRAGAARSGA